MGRHFYEDGGSRGELSGEVYEVEVVASGFEELSDGVCWGKGGRGRDSQAVEGVEGAFGFTHGCWGCGGIVNWIMCFVGLGL